MTFQTATPGRLHVSMRLGALTALVLSAIACGTRDAAAPLEPSGAIGRVRFVNLITDTTRGRVNALLENIIFGVNLTYTVATPAALPAPATANYKAVIVGGRTLVLKRTIDTTVTVATIAFATDAGVDKTIYGIGGTGGSAVTSFLTTDDNTVAAANQTRVRIVNMGPTVGPIDVFITAAGADLSAATPVATNVAYQGSSPYLAITPGALQFRAVPAGTAPAARAAAVRITLSVTLAGGTGRTIVAADNNIGGAPLRAFVLTDR